MREHGTLRLLLAAWLVAAGTARAQPKTVEESAVKAEAKQHLDKGLALFSKGKFDKALSEFEKSYDLVPHWKLRYNISKCHLELKHYDEAAQGFWTFLKEGGEAIPATQAANAEKYLEDLKPHVAAIQLFGLMEGLTLLIDGKEIEWKHEGQVVYLGPGDHAVFIQLEDEPLVDTRMSLEGGDSKVIRLKKKPVGEEGEGAGEGKAEIVSESHEKAPRATMSPMTAAGWGTLGGAAAALVAACVTGGLVFREKGLQLDAEDEYRERYDLDPGDPALDGLQDAMDEHYGKARALAVSTNVLLGVGGALAVTAAVLLGISLGKKKESKPAAVEAALTAGPGELGLRLNWR
jgi:tetratricopeptide (TPR) repeat protein